MVESVNEWLRLLESESVKGSFTYYVIKEGKGGF